MTTNAVVSITDPTALLRTTRALIFDMDGVLWRGDMPLPGLQPFFGFLHNQGIPFALATNNSSKSVAYYVEKANRMGITVTAEQVLSSGVATAAYLRRTYPGQALRVHVLGGNGLREVMGEAGFTLVDEDADVVVVGMDWELTYDMLRRATFLIHAGARFVGTNGDRTFPTPEGLSPGAGSLLAALEASTDQQPVVIGKPEPILFQMALERLGVSAGETLMIGDRLETDILGAQRADIPAALVLTGVTTPDTLAASDITPDLVFPHLPVLLTAWQEALGQS